MNYNPYLQELQSMRERIDRQIQGYQIPAPITQNFQIAPTNNNELQSSFVSGIDQVKNTFMTKNGVFVDKDFTTLWYKDIEGKIRTFELSEIVEKDEKDLEIEKLKKEIKKLKEAQDESDNGRTNESTTKKKS